MKPKPRILESPIQSTLRALPNLLAVRCLLLLLLILLWHAVSAQRLIQTIKGQVVERDTRYPLVGATVRLLADSSHVTGATTDADGLFRIESVPVGRHRLKVSFIGYEDAMVEDIILTSAKESYVDITLKQSMQALEEVTFTGGPSIDAANEMATVSARSFSVEETERYAGSRGDPARMASNFAGVQGADDSRNDIVVRGNSPQGVLWRMEGINLPNPNHFNIPGTAGGPVSMINNKTLANSDFYTGAFPAEFGNTVAAVFDLRLRNGNRDNHEWSGQFGFLGTEIFGEGPISRKSRSSYLVSYRYSTLALFSKLNIDIGTEAIPQYQDGAFKLNFPTKGNGAFSVFGIAGKSNIDILISDQKEPDRNIYGENDRDQYFRSSASLIGVQFQKPVSESIYFSSTLAASVEESGAHHELVYRHLSNNLYVTDSLTSILDYRFRQSKLSSATNYIRRFGRAGLLNMGLNADVYFFDFADSARTINETKADYYQWTTRLNSQESAALIQPFIQWKYSITPRAKLVAGLHGQYFSLTNSFVIAEPRLGLTWDMDDRQTLSVGAGLHSQIQPSYIYFAGLQNNPSASKPKPHNHDIDFTRSIHAVAGYRRSLTDLTQLKAEVYYQYLFDVPVENKPSSFSMVNSGATFSRLFPDTLVNEGVGKNYGFEVTLERSFGRGYLFLLTGALYEARYQGSDGIWRDTEFNGNYIFNTLFTKEWAVRQNNVLSIAAKMTMAGGRRYGPVDEQQSEAQKDVVYVDAQRNSRKFDPYFRADFRINYKINTRKTTHEIALDLVNVFNVKNILKLTYAPDHSDPAGTSVREEYQLGFLPLFYYRIDF